MFLIGFTLHLAAAERMPAAVSIFPQKYFVDCVGRPYTQIFVRVGPRQSPTTYEPSPAQIVVCNLVPALAT